MKSSTWLKRMVGMAVAIQAGVVWAGDGPLTVRLGVSYRDFDAVSFKGGEFPNWGTQFNPGGPYGIQNATVLPLGVPFVILDYVRYNGSAEDVDSGSKMAPVIGFRYDLAQMGKMRLALVGNFQYYNVDFEANASGASGAAGAFTHEQYQHGLKLDGTLLPGVGIVGVRPGTTFSVTNQFDMDLYVLDLGLEARTTMDRFNVTLALGPSLTIANTETSQSQQASWTAQAPALAGGTYASAAASDSNTDFLLGAYAALGVTYDITQSWSIGLEYRYDYVSDNAGTSQAELDLSGSSGIIRLGYKF